MDYGMNIVLFEASELQADATLHLQNRRAVQLLEVKGVVKGSKIRAGAYGGAIHLAEVVAVGTDEVVLKLDTSTHVHQASSLNLTLVLALPRPQSLKKVLQTIAELGVQRVILTGADRVQKSYFQSKVLEAQNLANHITLGMEQAITTAKPEVVIVKRLEEAFEATPKDSRKFLAHPAASILFEEALSDDYQEAVHSVIAVGPEGGWSSPERLSFSEQGYTEVSSGLRMLRVDTAVSLFVAQFTLLRRMLGQKASE